MYVIAEIGSNFKTFEDCTKSIELAEATGADAVKFQHFTESEMFGFNSDKTKLAFPSIYDKTKLPFEWIPKLWDKSVEVGIDFMCTTFDPDKLLEVDPYVSMHKIASSDMSYGGLVEAALATEKKILISTGGHSLGEVHEMLEFFGSDRISLMYCESVYPANIYDLRKIELLKQFGLPVGVSDHSREIYSVPLAAQAAGAVYFEKHVNFTGVKSDDSPHSLNQTEFKRMVESIRGGLPAMILSDTEQDMVLMHNRRLIAVKDIKKGDDFVVGSNVGYFRSKKPSTVGSNPLLPLREKTAGKNYKQGEGVS
jgi:N-acetylneuraminate synthase